MAPTDIVLNIGVWLEDLPEDCFPEPSADGKTPHWDSQLPADLPACPRIPEICDLFQRGVRGVEHPPHLWWNSAVPLYDNGTVREIYQGGHPMDVHAACDLPEASVIDRRAALDRLEPDRSRQTRFWTQEAVNGTLIHLRAEASHAFNHALLEQLPTRPPPRGRTPHKPWRAPEPEPAAAAA